MRVQVEIEARTIWSLNWDHIDTLCARYLRLNPYTAKLDYHQWLCMRRSSGSISISIRTSISISSSSSSRKHVDRNV